jgi:hypothetical protein
LPGSGKVVASGEGEEEGRGVSVSGIVVGTEVDEGAVVGEVNVGEPVSGVGVGGGGESVPLHAANKRTINNNKWRCIFVITHLLNLHRSHHPYHQYCFADHPCAA